MNVVLVHGFLNRGGVMARLARHLTAASHHCLTPSLKPCDASCGLPLLADQLDKSINAFLPYKARFVLVGFSMGALVARHYLQELGGHERADAFFSIGGPHSGTWTAYLYPSEGVRQMRPRSGFLARLDQTAHRLASMDRTCYWTPYDLMVRPVESAMMAEANAVRIPSLSHALMVFDSRLHRDIEQRLAAIGQSRKHHPG